MVRGALAFALVAVDVGAGDPRGELRSRPGEVDAHAVVLREAEPLVVPERVGRLLRSTRDLDEPRLAEGLEGSALRVARVQPVPEELGVPYVAVLGDHVPVSGQEQLGVRVCGERRGGILPQARQEVELVPVVGVVHGPAVGNVQAPHPHARARGRDGPGFQPGSGQEGAVVVLLGEGGLAVEPDGQVLRSAPRNAPLPRDSAPSPANPLPRGGDSPRPPSAGRSGASPRAQAGAVQAARWSRETVAAALVWLLALAVVIAIVVLETIPSGSAHNAEGGSTSSTRATSPSSPTMTYSPVNWPTKVPSPSPAPGADGVTKVNDLDVTYLGVNLDATSQVAPYGNVPDYGKKVVGIKLRVKTAKIHRLP